MKKKSQEVNLLYLNNKKTVGMSNDYQKNSSKKMPKKKKTKEKKDDIIDLDNEIIIGLTKREPQIKKNKVKKIKKKKIVKNTPKRISAKTKLIIKITKWAMLFILLITAITMFMLSSTFNIGKIEVINNEKIGKEEIVSLSSIKEGTNIFKIKKTNAINQVKENAYIDKVKITRKLPDTVIIDIKERIITYMLEFANGYVYLNNQGYMLEISNEKKEVPIVFGILTEIENIKAGNRLITQDLQKLEIVLKIMETAKLNEIDKYITKIDISDSENYILMLEGEEKIVYLGDASNINDRIMYLRKVIEKEKGIPGEIFIRGNLNTEKVFFRQKV